MKTFALIVFLVYGGDDGRQHIHGTNMFFYNTKAECMTERNAMRDKYYNPALDKKFLTKVDFVGTCVNRNKIFN